MELTNKIYSSAEIAEWFGIKPNTFSNNRTKRLEILGKYCKFEDLGRKGIKVIEVYIPEYSGKTRKIVERDFKEAWHANPNSLKFASNYIYNKNKAVLEVKQDTIYQTTCAVKREWYGVPHKREGSKGFCKWVYAVIDYENERYRYLTEEEDNLRKKMIKEFFANGVSSVIKAAELKESYKNKEMSIEEYTEALEEAVGIAEDGKWDEFNMKFMKAIGEDCGFALELIDDGVKQYVSDNN